MVVRAERLPGDPAIHAVPTENDVAAGSLARRLEDLTIMINRFSDGYQMLTVYNATRFDHKWIESIVQEWISTWRCTGSELH